MDKTQMIKDFYQEFIYYRTYSRWNYEKGRREDWDETVDRFKDFWLRNFNFPNEIKEEFYKAIALVRAREIMPSMRLLWTAGKAAENDNICAYNCSYLIMNKPKKFAEMLYILMNGTGVGVSVERQFINQLPEVPEVIKESDRVIIFEDSKYGWADGLNQFIHGLYRGELLQYDVSKIRPRGAILKTFGGRASGAEPLVDLLKFITKIFYKARGRKLNSDEIADICCKIAEIVVVGGVRRSAIIILANPSDLRMRNYKKGQFWVNNPQRAMANISLVYDEKPKMSLFLDIWKELIEGQTGEPGIINRKGFFKTMLKQGRILEMPRKKDSEIAGVGCNPCGEIILKPNEFCNLTTVILKKDEKYLLDEIITKVKYATLLGTLQAMLTDFKFIEDDWRRNCEEERLLGVSLTGLADVGYLSSNSLKKLKSIAQFYNAIYAEKLGINRAKAITCIKPSGTVSQMVLGASGLHPAFAPYYIRRVRISTTDPLCQLLMDLGIPNKPEVGQSEYDCNTRVFEFPIHHESEVYRHQMDAIEQLEEWKKLKLHFCDHNPSCTVYVKDYEWLAVGDWIYKNWDMVGGLSFLPLDDAVYPLAPYEEVDSETFKKLVKEFPDVRIYDFKKLAEYEKEDYTTGAKRFECEGNSCKI